MCTLSSLSSTVPSYIRSLRTPLTLMTSSRPNSPVMKPLSSTMTHLFSLLRLMQCHSYPSRRAMNLLVLTQRHLPRPPPLLISQSHQQTYQRPQTQAFSLPLRCQMRAQVPSFQSIHLQVCAVPALSIEPRTCGALGEIVSGINMLKGAGEVAEIHLPASA